MQKLFNDLFTGKDNQTYEMGRFLWCAGCLIFFVLCLIDACSCRHFNPIEYGAGLGAVLAGGGAAIALKSKTEPDKTDAQKD